MMRWFSANARSVVYPNMLGFTKGRRVANCEVSTSRAVPPEARAATSEPSRCWRSSNTGAAGSATSNSDTTISWPEFWGWVATMRRVPSRMS